VGAFTDEPTGTYGGTYVFRPLGGRGEAMCFDFKDNEPEQCYFVRVTGRVGEFFNKDGRFQAVVAIEDEPAPELKGLKPKK
jgi:hypothetical protein